jgi:RHS repeat-associated protein
MLSARPFIPLAAVLILAATTASGQTPSSTNFQLPEFVENNGGGFRVGSTYQITNDVISAQPVEVSASTNFQVFGSPLVTSTSDFPSCGIYINGDEPLTSIEEVDLGLVCGHPSGCSQMQLSNNGVGWTPPTPYSTTAPWTLFSNDGNRKVFARFQNGLGNWSGPCYDEIELDTTAPNVTISPTGGTYMSTQNVAVTANEPGEIWFTTDGSDPTTSPTAQEYDFPVSIATDTTLSAYAVDLAGYESPVVIEDYEICTGSNMSISGTVVDATRDNAPMPLVVVTLDSGDTTPTDLNGHYSFTGLPRGWYNIESVTAPVPGYVTYQSEFKLCETSIAHDIVLTRSGTVYGTDTNSGYSSGGVNTSTGNYSHKVMDVALPGIGPSFVFERSYNSQDGSNGPLGYGWTWSFNVSLTEWPDGEMVMRWGDGKAEVWNPDGSGGWTPMYGVFSTFIENPDGTFTLRGKDLIEYRFDATNRLETVVDEYGNTITFSYAGGDLSTVVDTSGRLISFSNDASGRITNILDPIGRSVSFTYDGSGDLVTATNMEGKVTTYTYDDSHRMLTRTDPKGNVVVTNFYDDSRSAVVSQRDALDNETRYLYDVPNKITTIIDAEGNVFAHYFDDYLRLIQEEDARGYSSFRTYDDRGNLETVIDKNGNTTTYEHDDNGNVLTKTEPLGRITSATYDGDNNPLTKTDARGYATVFEYDPVNGNLLASYACGEVPAATCATDPTVLKTAYWYDPGTGQLTSVNEAVGDPILERTTTYQYDLQGNNILVTDALGNTSSYAYDAVGRKLSENHPLARAVAYEYDVMDRLILVTDGLGNVAQHAYDDNGNKTDHWDANSEHTSFTYDENDRLIARSDAMGEIEEYGYDGIGRRVTVVNARGATAAITYDGNGNVIAETDPTGNTVRYEYDGNGNRTAAINAKGARKELVYNELNLLVEVTNPIGNTETYAYDLNGNQITATNALGKTTTSAFDAFNRLETVTDPVGNTISNTNDLLGRLESISDARSHSTSFEYDLLDRLVGVTDAESGTVGATYDELGNRTSVSDPRGKVTAFSYDVLNRLTSATDPLGNSVVRVYDPVGNLTTLTDADGTTLFQYDHVYHVTEVTQPDLTTVSYTYDAVGNRTSITDPAGVTSFIYDLGDRVTNVTDPFGNTVGYTYDSNGNRNSIVYPGFKIVSYLFDELDRVVQVQDWGGVTTTYTYNTAGRLSTQTMGNGAVVTYTYDNAGRLISKEDRAVGGAVIASYTYTLDPNGNRTGLDMTQPLMPDVDPIDQTMGHNDGNQVVTNNAWTYTYDGKGNRITKTYGVSMTTYSYDFNNRLSAVSDGSNLWEYFYTSSGHRISSAENGIESRYLLDLNGPMESILAETDGINTVDRYYVYGDGPLYSVNGVSGERLYFHYDPLGNTVALSGFEGEVANRYAYQPYGALTGSVDPEQNPFTYSGKYGVTTESNGLYFMRARFYDPETRSFVSKDPYSGNLGDTQTVGLYHYARGNPQSLVDPKGEAWGFAINVALSMVSHLVMPVFIQDEDTLRIVQGSIGVIQLGVTIFSGDPTAALGMIVGNIAFEVGIDLVLEKIGEGVYGTSSDPNKATTATVGTNVYNDAPSQSQPNVNQATVTVRSYANPEDAKKKHNAARLFDGDMKRYQDWLDKKTDKPDRHVITKYIGVEGYANRKFEENFRFILADGFLDQQTLSFVEYRIATQIAALSQHRYRYSYTKGGSKDDGEKHSRTDAAEKRAAREQRNRDVARSIGSLYGQLISALSKHHVMIRDLSALPPGATGGIAQAGVYAGGGS